MACLEEATVLALVEGRLLTSAAAQAEAHMASCTECRQLISELARGTPSSATGENEPAPTIIAGRYQLERLLGEGGVGSVWAAKHLATRKPVALKFLKRSADERHQRRLLREARAAGAVRHPNVLAIHDVLELEEGSPVLVMDLLEGESLRQRLVRSARLSLSETAAILLPVASAIGAAHAAGIIHRDLKPENIFLCRTRGVQVLDFGIAKLTAREGDAATTSGLTHTGEILGTPYYMSPEQIFGEQDIDARSDLWALGVILYECLSGQRPFQGANVGQVLKAITTGSTPSLAAPGLPREIVALVDRLLARERARRPSDVRSVGGVLGIYANATAIAMPRRRSLWGLAILAAAVLAAAAGYWTWRPAKRTVVPVAALPTPASTMDALPPAPVALPPRPPKESPRPSRVRAAPEPAQPAKLLLPGGVSDQVPF